MNKCLCSVYQMFILIFEQSPVAGNTIVTYYGFTILDLVRLQEGEQYREESL